MDRKILTGAPAIAAHLLGDESKARRIYNLVAFGLPVFKIGGTLAARPERLDAWLAERESAAGDIQNAA